MKTGNVLGSGTQCESTEQLKDVTQENWYNYGLIPAFYMVFNLIILVFQS